MKRIIFVLSACFVLAAGSSAASLTVTSPNGNENWVGGSTHLITWTATGVAGKVKLVLFKAGVKLGDIGSDVTASLQSYSWVVGSYDAGTAPPAGDYKIKVRTLDNTLSDMSDGTFTIGPPSPSPGPAFALTAPNGGESWPLGSTHLITWNPGAATGSVRLDLYKGGTNPNNIIGTITTMTAAAPGQFSWHVGDREGNTPAALGEDYYVVVHAYTPDMKDPGNAPFKITASESHAGAAHAKTAQSHIKLSSFALTNPRRGDRWYKGTGYNIAWTTGGLEGSKVRLDLMQLDGTTLVQPIAENIPNNGQYFWAVPMSLPDAETLYRMRVRTMDNAHSDTPAAFYITKAKAASGPPAIKVVAPGGPAQLGTGYKYAIRWTSTCGTSVNGPTDDAFDIELMNAAGTARARLLLESGKAAYDGGNPDGSHSWHWDWSAAFNETPGTYRIRVKDMAGQCVGLGEPFALVHPQAFVEYTIKPVVNNCFYLGNWVFWGDHSLEANVANLAAWHMAGGDPAMARVGYRWFVNNTFRNAVLNDRFDITHQIILQSFLAVSPDWYKGKGQAVMSAKLVITRKWTMPVPNVEISVATQPCLGGVVMLDKIPGCQSTPNPQAVNLPPALSGLKIPVASGQGDTWEVDVTDFYRVKIQTGTPDLGWVLYPYYLSDPGPGTDCNCQYVYQNVERYDVFLKIRMAKDIE
jgi:hypothetical protein